MRNRNKYAKELASSKYRQRKVSDKRKELDRKRARKKYKEARKDMEEYE